MLKSADLRQFSCCKEEEEEDEEQAPASKITRYNDDVEDAEAAEGGTSRGTDVHRIRDRRYMMQCTDVVNEGVVEGELSLPISDVSV